MAVLTSCAFTGHRPSHFSFQYDESAPGCIRLKAVLEKQILRLHHRGVTDFFSGCALGVDLWAGEAVLSLKQQNPDLQLHCIIPSPCSTNVLWIKNTAVLRKYAPSEGHLDLRQTAWYVLPQTGIMGGRHGT